MINAHRSVRFTLWTVCLLLTACAGMGQRGGIDERAQSRWDTLLGGDLAGAYEFLSPGYRSSMATLDYQRNVLLKRVKWESASVQESTCGEDTCSVKVDVNFSVRGALPGVPKFESHQVLTENWVRSDAQWWYVPVN
jgi:hypothetical protein